MLGHRGRLGGRAGRHGRRGGGEGCEELEDSFVLPFLPQCIQGVLNTIIFGHFLVSTYGERIGNPVMKLAWPGLGGLHAKILLMFIR